LKRIVLRFRRYCSFKQECQPVITWEDVDWRRTAGRPELVSVRGKREEKGPVLNGRRTDVGYEKAKRNIMCTMASNAHDSERPGSAPDFQLLIDSVPALIHTSLPDGYLDFFNQSWLEYVGRSLEDLQGWKWTAAIHPDDVEGIVEEWRASLASGKPLLYEARVRRADGENRWMLHHKIAIRDEHGKIIKWHGSSIDIEDRKRAEEKLRLSEAELRRREAYLAEAQRLSHTGSFGWNVMTGELFWSEESFRIFECDRSAKPTVDLVLQRVHPEETALVKQTIERASQDGRDFDFKHRLLMSSGSIKHLHVSAHAVRDESGKVEFIGSVMDITEAKGAEERLRQDEMELRQIVDAVPQHILVLEPDGRPLYVNRRDLDYTGMTLEEALAPDLLDRVFHPDDLKRLRNEREAAIARGLPWESEARLLGKNRKYRWFLIRLNPLRDEQGRIIRWYGTRTDIDDRKQVEDALRQSEAYLAEAQRLTQTGSFAYNPVTRKTLYWSEELFRIFRLDPQRGIPDYEETRRLVHPDDIDRVSESCLAGFREKAEFSQDYRLILHDGTLKHLHIIWRPVLDEVGDLVQYVGTAADATDRRCAEEERQSHLWFLESIDRINRAVQGTNDLDRMMSDVLDTVLSIFACDRAWLVYPCDPETRTWRTVMERTRPEFPGAFVRGLDFSLNTEVARVHRLVRASNGAVRFGAGAETPVPTGIAESFGVQSQIMMAVYPKADKPYMFGLDQCTHPRVWTQQVQIVFEAIGKRLTDTLTSLLMSRDVQESSARLEQAQRIAHVGYWEHDLATDRLTWSDETYRIGGLQPQERPMVLAALLELIHPEDRETVVQAARLALRGETRYNVEHRVVRPNGEVRFVHSQGDVTRDAAGRPCQMFGTMQDITDRKTAEKKIRGQEEEFRQLMDLVPQHIFVQGPDGNLLYANRAALDYYGQTLEEWQKADRFQVFHPGDRERLESAVRSEFLAGLPHEEEGRLRRSDGAHRWFLFRRNPLRDEQGRLTRWYVSATDIEERKLAEERLRDENIALREEIDKASMFEEIVGTSPVLQKVLSRISKVGPTDSTVLLTGETGTGKELIARAIHRRSHRSSRPFVSVNCAAVPRDLIASELFGHEKGAFTGAHQRRLGRFELAEGGTIFLDEVGDLPPETQVALLRVLQEREFERVGGNRLMRANVRVIAATNRDIEVDIGAGSFRRDLFYRLNVFPIESPPLRERQDDIPMLVEYFIDRYARKAGKRIRNVEKTTMLLLSAYSWPGNIRELQNVIERSVILCEGETISVDPSWLSLESAQAQPKGQPFGEKSAAQGRDMIEAALAKTGGKVSGPSGAAAALGIPASTLESKIRSLGINKFRFKHATH
jgi:PAS domain S-box-containing protein